ncbi:glutamate--cysteine ligase [Georgenia halophila]|uniref:Putative glutamate--cysteine ligase 2 n=1 Tax=Georgenia halophila TaxID=620889 RepID=A0ABP8LD06_9MICO
MTTPDAPVTTEAPARQVRTVGVEEEMLLVEGQTGQGMTLAGQVLAEVAERSALAVEEGEEPGDVLGGVLEGELNEEQIEVGSQPHTDMAALAAELQRWRRRAGRAARQFGARVAAVGLSPVPIVPHKVNDERYRRLTEQFGLTAAEQITCGCHVHVSIADRSEAVAVIDRIRAWLPALVALSANSPFWQGRDTSYASYRSLVMSRWPSAGPTELFRSAEAYDKLVADMVDTGVIMDAGMVYFDARASQRYPTVEIRVADVCLDVADTVLIAALCRALVDRAATEASAGEEPLEVPVTLLRLAGWQAARQGISGDLLDPVTMRPAPAWEVLEVLLERLRPALRANGDETLVEDGLERIRLHGTGAARQRRVYQRTGSLEDVVADTVRVTAGMEH